MPDELFGPGVAEAYLRAGSRVHLLRERVEQRRLALRIDGADPWCLPSCLQVQALCAWNAFALQILGEALLEPEGAPHSHTTATQALALFAEVEPWLSCGFQAADNEQFVLDRDVPASLPVGGELEAASQTQLAVTLRGMRSLRRHAEAAASILDQAEPPPDRRVIVGRLRQLRAQAASAADYAEELYIRQMPPRLREQVHQHTWTALHNYFLLGQLVAMPQLAVAEKAAIERAPVLPRSLPNAGDADVKHVPKSLPATTALAHGWKSVLTCSVAGLLVVIAWAAWNISNGSSEGSADFLVLTPSDGATVSSQTLTITGRAGPGERIRSIGHRSGARETISNGAGEWRLTIDLVRGVNRLILERLNRTGTPDLAYREVTYAPVVSSATPTPRATSDAMPVLRHVSDASLGCTDLSDAATTPLLMLSRTERSGRVVAVEVLCDGTARSKDSYTRDSAGAVVPVWKEMPPGGPQKVRTALGGREWSELKGTYGRRSAQELSYEVRGGGREIVVHELVDAPPVLTSIINQLGTLLPPAGATLRDAPSPSAKGALDANSLGVQGYFQATVGNEARAAQVFTVKNSGAITEVQARISRVRYEHGDLPTMAPTGELKVSIVKVDTHGKPAGVLSSTVVPDEDVPLESSRDRPVGLPVVATFEERPSVVSGGRYALVVDSPTCCYTWWKDNSRYNGGHPYVMGEFTSGQWKRDTFPLNFAVFVDARD